MVHKLISQSQSTFYLHTFLLRLRQSRIPSVTLLGLILNWIWPRDRCRSATASVTGSFADRWGPDFLHPDLPGTSLGRIHRAPDGRFVLVDSALTSRANSISNSSSSDDGGFLARRGTRGLRASWRRPLVGYPSQLSLRSDGSGQSARGGLSAFLGVLGSLTQQPRFHQHPAAFIPAIYSPAVHHLAALPSSINTPRFQSSSPTVSGALLPSPWTPVYFSDLSSVQHPSSAERSFPTPPGYMQLRNVHQRYSQELPSLRAIHEETKSIQGFIPVHPLASPTQRVIRVPPPYPILPVTGLLGTTTLRPRARLFPRHARITRSAPELASPDQQITLQQETSPESRSSSSGFGSKNTSSQQNQSSRSGSSAEWRLPPYRPPPPAPQPQPQQPQPSPAQVQPLPPPPPPPMVGQWLEFTSHLRHDNNASPMSSDLVNKAVDVGSVDGHYEFDPATPTPTPSTPTGPRDERGISDSETLPSRKVFGQLRSTRYDNIEARVQAMKEEFHEFRKRQAKRRRSQELESAC